MEPGRIPVFPEESGMWIRAVLAASILLIVMRADATLQEVTFKAPESIHVSVRDEQPVRQKQSDRDDLENRIVEAPRLLTGSVLADPPHCCFPDHRLRRESSAGEQQTETLPVLEIAVRQIGPPNPEE